MSKKVLKLALIGFFLGMLIGNLISFLSCDKSAEPLVIVSPILIERTGSVTAAMIVNTLLSGLLGAVAWAGVIFHDPEVFDWGMTKAAVCHFLLIMAVNLPVALYCGWCPPDLMAILIWIGIMALAYFFVWLIMFLIYKRKTEELNELLRRDKRR